MQRKPITGALSKDADHCCPDIQEICVNVLPTLEMLFVRCVKILSLTFLGLKWGSPLLLNPSVILPSPSPSPSSSPSLPVSSPPEARGAPLGAELELELSSVPPTITAASLDSESEVSGSGWPVAGSTHCAGARQP